LIVSDQGQGFDMRTVPEFLTVENLEAEHGRGIHLMRLLMDRSRSNSEAPRFTCARGRLAIQEPMREATHAVLRRE
jgi:anti-sigma regulatory factor (Ser/Thr protein kinase)